MQMSEVMTLLTSVSGHALVKSFSGTLTPSKTRKNGCSIRYYYSNRLITKGADPTGWRLRADMMEEALQDIVKQRLGRRLHRMQIAPLMKPHDVNRAIQAIRTVEYRSSAQVDCACRFEQFCPGD